MKARLLIVVDTHHDGADLQEICENVVSQVSDTLYINGTTGQTVQWSCTVEEVSEIDEG